MAFDLLLKMLVLDTILHRSEQNSTMICVAILILVPAVLGSLGLVVGSWAYERPLLGAVVAAAIGPGIAILAVRDESLV